jgi:hypothetical protein
MRCNNGFLPPASGYYLGRQTPKTLSRRSHLETLSIAGYALAQHEAGRFPGGSAHLTHKQKSSVTAVLDLRESPTKAG